MSRPSASGPAWRSVLLAAMLLLAPGGAHGTTWIRKQLNLFLVDVVLVSGPEDGLAEETAWWEAHYRADVQGSADLLDVHLWNNDPDWAVLVGVPALGPARYGAVRGLALGLGGCAYEPHFTFPRGRFVITEAGGEDEWLIGATAEMAVSVLVLTYTDEAGATYRVTFE